MKKSLAVGINRFLHPGNDLSGCVPDARAMAAVGELLGCSPAILTDSMAVKRNIIRWLGQVLDEALEGKLSYVGFSYSAHGTHYARPEEPDGLGEALVCYDVASKGDDWDPDTIIKDWELRKLLNRFPLACTVEVWLDTCYSGGMDRGLVVGLRCPHCGVKPTLGAQYYHEDDCPLAKQGRFLHNPNNPSGILRVSNANMSQGLNSNIIMWQACSEAQTSADAWIAGGPHGAFTWFWTQEFKVNRKASRVDLLVATRAGLQQDDYNQFPRLKCWNAVAQRVVGE